MKLAKTGLVKGRGLCVRLNLVAVALSVTSEFVLAVLMMYEFFDEAHAGGFDPLAWFISATFYASVSWIAAISHLAATSRHNQGTTLHGRGSFRFNVWANGIVATLFRMIWATFWMMLGWTYYVRYDCETSDCGAYSATAPVSVDPYHRLDAWRHFVFFGFDTFRMSWFLTFTYVLFLRFDQRGAMQALDRYVLVPTNHEEATRDPTNHNSFDGFADLDGVEMGELDE